MPAFEYVNATEDRIDDLIEVLVNARADDPHERRLSREEARAFYLRDVDFDPNAAWIVLSEAKPIAFGWAVVEKNRVDAGMDDGFMEVDVVKEFRGKGVEEELIDRCLTYIRSRGVRKARSRSMQDDRWKKNLLESHAFSEAYRVYDLIMPGRSEIPEVAVPEGYVLETHDVKELSEKAMAEIIEAFNESFLDHYNFVPEPKERFMKIMSSVEDPWQAILARKDDAIAGLCLAEKSDRLNAERGENTGWIVILGVRPPYRRRGLARAMLAEAADWLSGQGLESIQIAVQAKNENALNLYKSFGFVKQRESISYEKLIGQ